MTNCKVFHSEICCIWCIVQNAKHSKFYLMLPIRTFPGSASECSVEIAGNRKIDLGVRGDSYPYSPRGPRCMTSVYVYTNVCTFKLSRWVFMSGPHMDWLPVYRWELFRDTVLLSSSLLQNRCGKLSNLNSLRIYFPYLEIVLFYKQKLVMPNFSIIYNPMAQSLQD